MANFPIVKVKMPSDLKGATNGQIPDHLMKGIEPSGKMHHLAADAWNAMFARAAAEGVHLANVGSFRSYDSQYALFMQRYVKGDSGDSRRIFRTFQGAKWMLKPKMAPAASPGTSNHGWGLAIDACLLINGKKVGIGGRVPGKNFTGVDWLMAHAHNYGFSWELQSEPWHIRYVVGDNVPQAVKDWLAGNPPSASIPAPPVIAPEKESPRVTIVESDPPWPGGRGLRVGMKNSAPVREVQSKLGLKIDGWFGKQTKAAVVAFQKAHPECGPADGIVGPKTWRVMFKKQYPFPGDIKIGMKNNDDVRLLQKKLGILSDGWFGKQSKAAVVKFQKENPDCGRTDGIVDAKTWAVLFR